MYFRIDEGIKISSMHIRWHSIGLNGTHTMQTFHLLLSMKN